MAPSKEDETTPLLREKGKPLWSKSDIGRFLFAASAVAILLWLCWGYILQMFAIPLIDMNAHVPFDRVRIARYSAFSAAAYRPLGNLQSWTCKPCTWSDVKPESVVAFDDDVHETRFFTAKLARDRKKQLVITFRGTVLESIAKWHENLDAFYAWTDMGTRTGANFGSRGGTPVQHPDVHRGFYDLYRSLESRLFDHILGMVSTGEIHSSTEIVVAGHSLGGALATLAAYDLKVSGFNVSEVYTYGSPRVGSRDFARGYASSLGAVTWRVVNHNDKVPHLPHFPFYHHVPAEVHCLSSDGSCDDYRIGNGSGEDPTCSFGSPVFGLPSSSITDHCKAMGYDYYDFAGEPGLQVVEDHRPQDDVVGAGIDSLKEMMASDVWPEPGAEASDEQRERHARWVADFKRMKENEDYGVV